MSQHQNPPLSWSWVTSGWQVLGLSDLNHVGTNNINSFKGKQKLDACSERAQHGPATRGQACLAHVPGPLGLQFASLSLPMVILWSYFEHLRGGHVV